MAGSLRPCSACARHIRVGEAACPFCGAASVASIASAASGEPSSQTRGRLTRAAILFAGATAVAACGGKETTVDDGSSGSSGSLPVPMYGPAPIDRDASTDADAAPVDLDASSEGGRDASSDAKSEGGGVPLYGIPPMDE